jgi:hypothetical protein
VHVRRGFCSECGSSLFFDQDDLPKMAFCAGSVDAPTELTSKAHIFIGSKGDYHYCSMLSTRRDGSVVATRIAFGVSGSRER